MTKEFAFKTLTTTSRRVPGLKVVLEWIGEGYDGDFNPADPTDYPHLRFTVYKDGEPVDDGSYCTALSGLAARRYLRAAAKTILAEAERTLGSGFKKAMAWMSWIGQEDPTTHDYEGHGYQEAA